MPLTAFNMMRTLALMMLAGALLPQLAHAQAPAQVLSSEIAISRERAEIQLQLADGRNLTFATIAGDSTGGVQRTGDASGDQVLSLNVQRGSVVDRSWRDLLNAAMDVEPEVLGMLLHEWDAPEAAARPFDAAIQTALGGVGMPGMGATAHDDSLIRL